MTPDRVPGIDRRVHLFWGLALIGLVIFTIWRVGGFNLTTTLESGRSVPDMFASVDHPFHTSRGASLLESLKHGEILRWMSSHQGGYPVEFYPLGVAWIDVIIWVVALGSIPILAVHKITVVLVLVMPALAYWLLVRGDRLHPSIAFLAMAFHIAIPGYWLNGGYEELVGWGLVTNVAGATLAVISTILLARYVMYKEHLCGVMAVLAIAAGAVSNPRSLFGVVLASLAIGVWSIIVRTDLPVRKLMLDTIVSIGAVGLLSLLIAAPVISALLRYSSEYFFLHYQFYDPLSMFWDALHSALSSPLLLLAIVSSIALFVLRPLSRLRVSQTIALTVAAYTIFTIWVARTTTPPPLVEQLEAPRLMPFQRLLMLVLAAIVIVLAVQRLAAKVDATWREAAIAVVVLGISIGSITFMIYRGDDAPLNEHALYSVTTSGDQRFANQEDAVVLANELRQEGSAIFVIGNHHEWWHEQLWAPGIVDGTYYFDDWMWYWHRTQPGPYDPTKGYYMDNPTFALTQEYFDQHGIGVVMVTDMWVSDGTPPRKAAAESDLLQYESSAGDWDIYTVIKPTSIATRGDALPTEVSISNQEIHAKFVEGNGNILVRQNWFPRWQAEVNGKPVDIVRDESGYMLIPVPAGPIELDLTYGVTGMDWVSRLGSVSGVLGLVVFAWRGRAWRSGLTKESVHCE